jgi:transcription elongation GreA/GreB family factor
MLLLVSDMNHIKKRILSQVSLHLNQKLKDLNAMMQDLNEASKNETKSTVGDKHETSKAMMHLEQEKLGNQIKEIEFQLKEFNAVNFDTHSNHVVVGSLVETNLGYFFIATAIGKIQIDNLFVFAISNKSPLGSKFLGLKPNDSIEFNNLNYTIISVM